MRCDPHIQHRAVLQQGLRDSHKPFNMNDEYAHDMTTILYHINVHGREYNSSSIAHHGILSIAEILQTTVCYKNVQ